MPMSLFGVTETVCLHVGPGAAPQATARLLLSGRGALVDERPAFFGTTPFPGTGKSFLAVVDVFIAATKAKNAKNALAFLPPYPGHARRGLEDLG